MITLRSRLLAVALLVLAACTLGGCFGFRGPEDVRAGIEQASGVTLEGEMSFNIGPLGMMLANAFVPDEAVPFPLRHVHSVEVGEYRIIEPSEGARFDVHDLALSGWEPVARMRDGTEQCMVLLDADDDSIDRVLFVERDGDEVHIVRAKGRLDLLLDALLEHEFAENGDVTASCEAR